MAQREVVYLGEFIENVQGAVTNPANAIGDPGTTFTGNTTGSWTARWALQAPTEPVLLTKYAKHQLRLHVRRANSDPNLDPVIWRVRVKDALGRDILDFRQCGQINPLLGTFDPLNSGSISSDWSLKDVMREVERRREQVQSWGTFNEGWDYLWETPSGDYVFLASVVAGGTCGIAALERTDNNYAIIAESHGNTPANAFGADNTKIVVCSTTGKYVAAGWFNTHRIHRLGVVNEAPAYIGTLITALPNWPTTNEMRGIAFSPDEQYMVATVRVTTHEAVLYRLSDVAPFYENITPAVFMVPGDTDSHIRGVAWKGTRVAFATKTGYKAFNWNQALEEMTHITETTGTQYGGSYGWSQALTLSADGRWLAVLQGTNHTLRPKIHIHDLDNPAETPRTLELTHAYVALQIEFLGDSRYLAFTSLPFSSMANIRTQGGYLNLVYVPDTGPLVFVSKEGEHQPLSMQTVHQFQFSQSSLKTGWWMNNGSNAKLNLSDFLAPLRVHPAPNPIRDKDVLVLESVVGSPQIAARIGVLARFQEAGTETSPVGPNMYFGTRAFSVTRGGSSYSFGYGSNTGIESCDPFGRFLVYRGSTRFYIYDIRNRDLSKDGLPPNWFYESRVVSTSTGGYTGSMDHQSWSNDGKHLWQGVRDCFRFDDDGEGNITVHHYDPLVDATFLAAAVYQFEMRWRRKLSGDTTPETLVGRQNNNVNAVLQVIDGVLVDKSSEIVFPELPTNIIYFPLWKWSKDGEYVILASSGAGSTWRIWKWNNGTPIRLVWNPSVTSFPTHVRVDWSEVDPHVFFVMSDISESPSSCTFSFWEVDGDTVTQLGDSGTRAQITSFLTPGMFEWLDGGRYFAHTVHYANTATAASRYTVDTEDFPQFGKFVYKWDKSLLNSGLQLIPDVYGGERHMPLWTDAPHFSSLPRTHRNIPYKGAMKNFSVMACDMPNWFRYGVDASVLDYEQIWFEAGWTVEIETIGSTDNAVQLAGIELELGVQKYMLATPTLLPPISVAGTRALVSWDWEPAP